MGQSIMGVSLDGAGMNSAGFAKYNGVEDSRFRGKSRSQPNYLVS
jgi:hypothetical protein